MVTHLKLSGGKFRHVEDESIVVENITGKLTSIFKNCLQTIFTFKTGEDEFVRLYLDNERRPVTRLLWLITDKLSLVADCNVRITSEGEERSSRLKLTILAETEAEAECPHDLPPMSREERCVYNGINLRRIAAAMAFTIPVPEEVEEDEDEHEDDFQQEETAPGVPEEVFPSEDATGRDIEY